MPERVQRSRLHRGPLLVPLVLQQRDLVVLRDLFYYRFADTRSLDLSASWANGSKGLQYFSKRLTHLWRAGIVERFTPAFSRYVHGSRHFLYTIGSGKASAAARTGLRPDAIPEDRWREVLAQAGPARLRAREALLAIGIDGAEIDRVLHNNTVTAMRFISGDTSGVQHHALAAEALSTIWLRARMEGHQVDDVRPDGVADLSFREPDPHRYRELVTADGVVVIKPDCLFTIAGQRYALEAETGALSTTKLRLKLSRYRLLLLREPALHLLVHCATQAHADRVSEIARASEPYAYATMAVTTPNTLAGAGARVA
ncbi:MAG: hypothetical protein ABI779_15840 [Acidobacteriota bacterium]